MTVADLKVEGIANYQRIANIEIFEAMHRHGICKITFVMKDDFQASEVVNWAQKAVTVKGKVDNSDKFVFGGVATSYGVENHAGAIFLNVTVETLSSKLAVSKKAACTFQKDKKKISDMLNEVKKSYEGADLAVAEDKEVPELIYRNNLTDWEFLTELAERYGRALFCDSKTDKLKICLGFKAFKEFDGKKFPVLRQSLPLEFGKRLEKNVYSSARPSYFIETDFFTYDVEIGVGHGVKYDNQTQAVIASHIYLRDNILCNEIKVRYKEGCRVDAFTVTDYFDRFYYITGKVLKVVVEDEKAKFLKIQFDCDSEQNEGDALKIPYESVVNNYLFTMPDENDKVFVYVDKNRQAAMGSLRASEVNDKPENKSFKMKDTAELTFEPKKMSFVAAKDQSELIEEDGLKLNAKKDINFVAKGDIYIQSAAGGLPDDQIQFATTHLTQYVIYTAAMGQPATVAINPAGSTVGKVQSELQKEGAKKEDVELSDLAKELDKITKRQNKQQQQQAAGGGSGGTIKLDSKKEFVFNVKNSFIGLKGSQANIKARVLNNLGYVPVAGGGTGSGGAASGSPEARSETIKAKQGQDDHSRVAENIQPTDDKKDIDIGV